MKPRYQRVRGTRDLVDTGIGTVWTHNAANLLELQYSMAAWCARFGYRPIILPIFEEEALFTRSLGEETDVVHKELYRFQDRKGRKLALRPEGTAGVCRAVIENGLLQKPPFVHRFYYFGPMFRYDRPQEGRYRQFYQFGVECFNHGSPFIDAQQIYMANEWLKEVGITDYTLKLNNIGCEKCRPDQVSKLQEEWRKHSSELCDDCMVRVEKNPLRVLDCKIRDCYSTKGKPPEPEEFLCEDCRQYFKRVEDFLTDAGIKPQRDPRLVRGLDYYTGTTFEFVSDKLGAQGAIIGGGRYDHLVEELGGLPTSAIGWSAGLDRILTLLPKDFKIPEIPAQLHAAASGGPRWRSGFISENEYYSNFSPSEGCCFFIFLEQEAEGRYFGILNDISLAGIFAAWPGKFSSLKKQLDRANKAGAKLAVIVGPDELAANIAIVKDLRNSNNNKNAHGTPVEKDKLVRHVIGAYGGTK